MTEKCAKSQGAPAFESRLQPVAVRQVAAIGAKRPFDVSQVLTVKSPGYSLCYLLVGYAIYPPTRHLAVKVRLFIDFLVERFSAGPKAGIGRSNAMDA